MASAIAYNRVVRVERRSMYFSPFGSRAISKDPCALRPRLTTGLPLSLEQLLLQGYRQPPASP